MTNLSSLNPKVSKRLKPNQPKKIFQENYHMSTHWIFAKTLSACLLMTQACSGSAQSLDQLIDQALAQNLTLKAAQSDASGALAALDAARAERLPSLKLSTRALFNEGGRVIEIPVADALNPVYATLNRLSAGSSQPTQFPQIENPAFSTIRDREFDARLSLSTPLYAPGLEAGVQRAMAEQQGAGALSELAARTLIRDVQLAYFNVGRARASREIFSASERVLNENVRVNQALLDAGSATRDKLLRAQAEVLAAQDRTQGARDAENSALRYLNFLRAMPLDTALVGELEARFPQVRLRSASQIGAENPQRSALAFSVAAASAGIKQAESLAKPNIGFGLDTGTQGENFGFGSGKNFSTAAISLNWTLFDFGTISAKKRAASAIRDRRQQQLDELDAALALRQREAQEKLASAILRTQTQGARLLAASENYRIAEKQRAAGSLSQIEFLDAEQASTQAQLAAQSARFEQAIASAELEFASASYPLSNNPNNSKKTTSIAE